ncbi:LytR/AlgR family response regulator transcription factor [Maribellus maritimus]|uniref:LytR/AlgR family response regulator transcription factor n=1 Tax=Maribellus maritimus TaxID=2870838 RepID=UPI001EE9F18E|nr:LytTR family DNA-binding domain-containing protein [Maribellus maritimus]MCG6187697.1 LytTR family DNA-binding domain-containing protein [Maribellus maritimus]
MNYQKIAIIDDSSANIKDLKEELARYQHIKIVGSATQREQAIRLIKNEKPDVVFLDVQLELDGITGFELLQELKELELVNFVVIFYTAYEKYAIEAIRASAFDFLLKPIDPIQLSIVISRIQANPVFNTNINVEKLINQLSPSPKVALQTIKGTRFVKHQSIVFIQLENKGRVAKQVVVNLIDGEKIKLAGNITINGMLKKIDNNDFFKISRQTIVNIHYLDEIENSSDICRMANPYRGVELKVSRNHMSELRRKFSLS